MTAYSNKRVRRDTKRDTNAIQLQLSDLPGGILPKVASFLPNTSCVSFAFSLFDFDAPITSSKIKICKAIINASEESWEILNFKDIQDVYGRSLIDDDIRWILLAIDGVDKIKSLYFTNCTSITGVGLQPLTGSTVLERIDLSLVYLDQNPTIDPEPPISVSVVVPILNSIIEREDNVLEHVQLPKKWRVERSNVLTQFLQRFDRVLNGRRYPCFNCGKVCQRFENEYSYELVNWGQGENDAAWWQLEYGVVSLSCHHCEKNFCGGCENDYDFNFCRTCERYYCRECNNVNYCQGSICTKPLQPASCVECNLVKDCDECGLAYCQDCVPAWVTCQFCEESICNYNCYMNICQGGGCERANCNGLDSRGNYSARRDCTSYNQELPEPECVEVRECKDEEDDEENHKFCSECWEKQCEGIK